MIVTGKVFLLTNLRLVRDFEVSGKTYYVIIITDHVFPQTSPRPKRGRDLFGKTSAASRDGADLFLPTKTAEFRPSRLSPLMRGSSMSDELLTPDPERLLDLVRWRMPFGKYEGVPLLDLPQPYLVWFAQKGFPKGRLGEALALCLEVKHNGLERMVRKLAKDGGIE